MNASNGAGAAMAASASNTPRLPAKGRVCCTCGAAITSKSQRCHPCSVKARSAMAIPEGFAAFARVNTYADAAVRFGVSKHTAVRWARRCGITKTRQQWVPTVRVKRDGQADGSRAGRAADFLRKRGPVWRCGADGTQGHTGKFWKVGSAILTDAQLIERAEAKRGADRTEPRICGDRGAPPRRRSRRPAERHGAPAAPPATPRSRSMTHVRFDRAALAAALAIVTKVKGWAPAKWKSITIRTALGKEEVHWRDGPPMLEIVTNGTMATIRSASFDRQLSTTLRCEGDARVVLPAEMLSAWVSRLTGPYVDMEVRDDDVALTSGRLRCTLRMANAAHYPTVRAARPTMIVLVAELLAGFTATVAVPKDEAEAGHRGIHMRGTPGDLRFFAAQQGRIHERQSADATGANVIIPVDTARLFLALFSDSEGGVEVAQSEATIAFRLGQVRLASGVIDGGAVHGDREFARARPNALRARADELLADIELATTISDPKHGDFTLRLGQPGSAGCVVKAHSQGGRDVASVEHAATWSGEPLSITFALKPVRDALLLFGSREIEWRMAGPLDTTTIALAAGGEVRALVAPYLPQGATEQKAKAA